MKLSTYEFRLHANAIGDSEQVTDYPRQDRTRVATDISDALVPLLKLIVHTDVDSPHLNYGILSVTATGQKAWHIKANWNVVASWHRCIRSPAAVAFREALRILRRPTMEPPTKDC